MSRLQERAVRRQVSAHGRQPTIEPRSVVIEAKRWSQRGATLTGYALIMSAMLAAVLGAVRGLDEGSTAFLESTGDSIGEARPTGVELAAAVTEDEPGDGPIPPSTTAPPASYDWQAEYGGLITTGTGLCVGDRGGEPLTATCSADGSVQTQFFANDADDTDQVQVRINGRCMTRIADDTVAALVACQDGNDDQLWLQTPSGNLASVGSPGQCLDIDGAAVGSPGADVYVWTCHGGGNQAFSFPGAYVPPTQPDVTSVPATQATLTGNFELDADGFVYAPDGTGSHFDGPGELGTATFEFTVAEAGQYQIEGTVIAPSGSANSFWVTTSLDGNTEGYLWNIGRTTSPSVDVVSQRQGNRDVVLDIAANTTFTITVSVREDGTRLGNLTLVAQ